MDKPLIKITIEGPQGSGKSTIARSIIDQFEKNGTLVCVSYVDTDCGKSYTQIETKFSLIHIFETQT